MPDPDRESNLAKQGLTALEQIIIAAHLSVHQAEGRALDPALRAGAALMSVLDRKLVPYRKRGEFFRQTCGGHERTAQIYIKLARHRSLIDAAKAKRVSPLTINEALNLIREAEGTKKNSGASAGSKGAPPSPPPKSLADWDDVEIADALFKLGYSRFVRVIPAPFRPRIQMHAGGQVLRLEQARNPNRRLKNIDPLRLVVDNEEPTPPTQH